MPADVFISHATEDQAVAAEVCALLEARGITCWIAPRDVAPGAQWDDAIVDAIGSAHTFLLILSAKANESPYVKNEVNHAFGARKTIFTFRVEEVVPGKSLGFYLARHHWMDGFPPPLDKKVDALAAAISADVQAGTVEGVGVATVVATQLRKVSKLANLRSTFKHMAVRERLAWSVATFALVAVGLMAIPTTRHAREATPESQAKLSFDIATPSAPAPNQVTVSPDGKYMGAFITSDKGNVIWLRALAGLNAQTVNGSEGAAFPFWSPDSRLLAFFVGGKLKKVDLSGAPPQTLCDGIARPLGGTWNRDGVIVFGTNGPLFRVSASGGVPVQLTELDASRQETAHRHPYFLPDGQHFLFTVASSKPENFGIYVGSIDSKERKRILGSALKAAFVPPDHVLFVRHDAAAPLAANAVVIGGTLMAQQFDAKRLEIIGEPFPIAGVGGNFGISTAGFAVSDGGVLAYRSVNTLDRVLQWYDRTGKPIGTVDVPGPWESPAVSPDLQRLAVLKRDGAVGDIWILDQARGMSTRFTFHPAFDDAPLWSPDGTRIVFSSDRNGASDLYQKNSAGTGQEELLLKSDHAKIPDDWSADGRFLLYRDLDPKTGWDLWVLPLTGDKKPQPVLTTPFSEIEGRFSPDGRWIAYVSDESGTNQVYVQSFPPSGSKWQISTGAGGYQPRWRHDGKELFFMAGGSGINVRQDVMAVAVDTSNAGVFRAGVPQKLFAVIPHLVTIPRNSWEVTPDGQRFLVVSTPTATGAPPVTVVVNWLQGLNAKAR